MVDNDLTDDLRHRGKKTNPSEWTEGGEELRCGEDWEGNDDGRKESASLVDDLNECHATRKRRQPAAAVASPSTSSSSSRGREGGREGGGERRTRHTTSILKMSIFQRTPWFVRNVAVLHPGPVLRPILSPTLSLSAWVFVLLV